MTETLDHAEAPNHLLIPGLAAAAAILIGLVQLIRLWTGPLSSIPGPAISRITGFVTSRNTNKGMRHVYLADLHKKYGPVVRVSPTEVSVVDLAATREIHKIGGGFMKTNFYTNFSDRGISTLFSTTDAERHSQLRRLLGPVMSEGAVKLQQKTVMDHVELLVNKLGQEYSSKGYMNVYRWAYYFATDVIGELAFGGSFKMLEQGTETQYIKDIKAIGGRIAQLAALTGGISLHKLPHIGPIAQLEEMRARTRKYALTSLDNYRRARDGETGDEAHAMFFDKLMGDKGKAQGITPDVLAVNAQGMLIAGTDTTAVTLTYLIYMLSTHPEARAKFIAASADASEVPSNDQLKSISYIDQCIDETLRLFGAAPSSLPRAVPRGGRTLAGHFVPQGYTASTISYVLHRDPKIFDRPDEWLPDRWEQPTSEMRQAFFAFGGGSRVCVGMHLARMELRIASVAFFKRFPNAVAAFGEEGFGPADMEIVDNFLARPKGQRCLIK